VSEASPDTVPASGGPALTPRVYVFDLDGVLYRGEDAVEGAAESLARLRRQRPPIHLFFLTNNSSQSRRVYADKLTRLGMPVTEDEIVTSASATAAYLADAPEAAGKTVLAVGGPGISDELTRIGMTVRRPEELKPTGEGIDYVVVGMDRLFNYHTLHVAQQAILHGATFIATNRDGQYPIEGGKVTPGGGAMVAALEACTDVTPIVIGKPETLGLQTILRHTGVLPEEAVMIGDRLDTDILCGNRLGVPTVLVLTGVTPAEKAASASPAMRPGRIIPTLREL
jgi:4-nitrophenyl phosphatase